MKKSKTCVNPFTRRLTATNPNKKTTLTQQHPIIGKGIMAMIDWYDDEEQERNEYMESGEFFEGMDSDDIENWFEDDD